MANAAQEGGQRDSGRCRRCVASPAEGGLVLAPVSRQHRLRPVRSEFWVRRLQAREYSLESRRLGGRGSSVAQGLASRDVGADAVWSAIRIRVASRNGTLLRRFADSGATRLSAIADVRLRTPAAQIRAGAIHALGSNLGCLTAKRSLGQGCRMRGIGSH